MKTIVLGASGATGQLVVNHLLHQRQFVTALVRPLTTIPVAWENHPFLTILRAEISVLSSDEAMHIVQEHDAIISCLGHAMSWKGIYGEPRKLVVHAVRLLCNAIERLSPSKKITFILMNTAGYVNNDADERISLAQKIAIQLIRTLIPPHKDNEDAAEFLRSSIGQHHPQIQWVVVRPDNLSQAVVVTPYEAVASPTSSLFTPKTSSRMNVAHFMSRIILDPELLSEWKNKMPVLYDLDEENK